MFIPVAKEHGLIQQITRLVIKFITDDVRDLFKEYPDFDIAINLSAADLKSRQTVDLLRMLICDINAGPHNLIVEATERGFMHANVAWEVIHEIRAHGTHIAIDDFGIGYSRLSYLETFELDYLKIDKSLVDTVGTGSATSQVISHNIEMVKSLNPGWHRR